jgi:hypothetical protein
MPSTLGNIYYVDRVKNDDDDPKHYAELVKLPAVAGKCHDRADYRRGPSLGIHRRCNRSQDSSCFTPQCMRDLASRRHFCLPF